MPQIFLANGDSYTAGDGMSDYSHQQSERSKLTWPGALCRAVNIPNWVNIAESGGGSAHQIARTTIAVLHELLYKHHMAPQNILVGVMYSIYFRFELPVEGKGWVRGYLGNKEKIIQSWIKYCLNEKSAAFYFYQHVYLLQSYLEKLGVNYFMMSIKNDFLDLNDTEYEPYKKQINFDKFFYINNNDKKYGFYDWGVENNYKQTPCSHFYEDAHNDFVNQHLIPWLKELKYI